MSSDRNIKKVELAYTLYMQGKTQKETAEMIDVSVQTVCKWAKSGNWEIKRASQTLSRRELVNKLLISINTTVDMINESGDIDLMLRLPEKLSGFANLIGKIESKDRVLELIEAFNGFNAWLELRALKDKRLTPEILRLIAELQDKYVDESIVEKEIK
jgi:transcriptional regulator with XRE-family HTH domain